MKRKIDSAEGRYRYSKRPGTVEPLFGHIQQMGMTQFRHRGKRKVDAQWQMYCAVHNLKKIHSGRMAA